MGLYEISKLDIRISKITMKLYDDNEMRFMQKNDQGQTDNCRGWIFPKGRIVRKMRRANFKIFKKT